MALISQKTNLKSLRYGKDRVGGGSSNQPYIKSSIPDNSSSLDRSGEVDFLLRGGTLTPSRAIKDVSRLTKMFSDIKSPNGLLFTAKQNLLSRAGVKTQASGIINEGAYLPTSTLLQVAGNAFGTHLNKQGINPLEGILKYSEIVKSNQDKIFNRLVQISNKKFNILPNSIIPSSFTIDGSISSVYSNLIPFSNQISNDNFEILKYGGGSGSTLGVGKTIIKRYDNTNEGLDFSKNPDFKDRYYVLNSTQINNLPISKDNTQISDFRKDLLSQQTSGKKKNILSKSLDYKTQNIEQRVNLGDPGKRNKNVSSYKLGLGEPLDKITSYPLYKSNTANNQDTNDLIKFRIGIIDNNTPNEKVYIHFRAFLDAMDDNYTADWNSFKYMGRGENFYRYNGFTRTINLSWTVAAQSKDELIPIYQKLNYLASSLTPDYSYAGYMRGNLATLTVGGYLYEQPGIITSINYSVPQESPWEIGISDNISGDVINDTSLKELPHIIRVTGFNFTPIHTFTPRLQQNTYLSEPDIINTGVSKNKVGVGTYGKERYIALSNGIGTSFNNYDDDLYRGKGDFEIGKFLTL